jgi:hypothetical protein
VEFQVGYIDLHRMIAEVGDLTRLKDDDRIELSVTPDITHRFVLSVNGLQLLKERVDEIFLKSGLNLGSTGEGKDE